MPAQACTQEQLKATGVTCDYPTARGCVRVIRTVVHVRALTEAANNITYVSAYIGRRWRSWHPTRYSCTQNLSDGVCSSAPQHRTG